MNTSEVAGEVPVRVRVGIEDINFGDYTKIGNCAAVCGAMTNDEIIVEFFGLEYPAVLDDDASKQLEAAVRGSLPKVMEAVGHARLFLIFEDGEEGMSQHIRAFEDRAKIIAFLKSKEDNLIIF